MDNTEPSFGTSSPDTGDIRPDKDTSTSNPQEAEDTTLLPHNPIAATELHTIRDAVIRTFYYDLTVNIKDSKPM